MESEEQWSNRDFTQIKQRRPEGTGLDWELEVEPSAFSFLWPATNGAGVEEDGEAGGRHGCGGDEDGNEKEEEQEHGEELQQQEQGEFEFSNIMSTATSSTVEQRLSPSGISPADELFFKGQLLPLHLPPRIQMVKKLVLERQHCQRGEQQEPQHEAPAATSTSSDMRSHMHRKVDNLGHVNAAMNALSQARFARLFQPKYSKFCNFGSADAVSPAPARLGNSWWDPRDSHAHAPEYSSSGGSFTSTDRDSSGDSSSSRDSNGSSQDCFDSSTAKDQFLTTTDSKGFFHNREVFSTHGAHPERSNGISTWLRPPFKWKVLFGAKKPSTTSSSSITLKPASSPYDIDMQPRARSMETADPPEMTFSPSPVSTDRYFSDCSGELTHSGDLLLSSRAFIHGGDMEKYPRGIERAKGYLHKYMKALNPNRSSKDHHEGTAPTRASPAITTSKTFPPFSQSFRFSPKDHIPLRSMKRPPPQPAPSPSPMPGPRRVSTSSASSELHCDIKGAIAHCKESQKQSSKQDDEVNLDPTQPKRVEQNVVKAASDTI
ncbi:hypothetical protein KC19_4G180000 [Ceratodon purpureus]|uniref:Uncharacterized protein n=1 Tax=Ceratodon purpureus TaxID=3225 RepID=A0A8T0IC78_CERPU|nr:hypothetical protein KC19_4G180000 [Ceratodon purpureus]KAG0580530.1 hypothetical protein KC19_4G180000 [Ceratodon purpureus]